MVVGECRGQATCHSMPRVQIHTLVILPSHSLCCLRTAAYSSSKYSSHFTQHSTYSAMVSCRKGQESRRRQTIPARGKTDESHNLHAGTSEATTLLTPKSQGLLDTTCQKATICPCRWRPPATGKSFRPFLVLARLSLLICILRIAACLAGTAAHVACLWACFA